MNLLDVIYPLLSAYDILESKKNKVLNNKVQDLIKEEKMLLKELASQVEKRNINDTDALNQISNSLNDLYSLRQVVDPRIHGKINSAIRVANDKMREYNLAINRRNAQLQNASNSMRAETSTSKRVVTGANEIRKEIHDVMAEKPITKPNFNNFEQQIKGGNENVQKK